MSSMLKKSGGLAFKPKVGGRRPGGGAAASSKPATTSASANTTRDPTTEPTSQTSTPAPTASAALIPAGEPGNAPSKEPAPALTQTQDTAHSQPTAESVANTEPATAGAESAQPAVPVETSAADGQNARPTPTPGTISAGNAVESASGPIGDETPAGQGTASTSTAIPTPRQIVPPNTLTTEPLTQIDGPIGPPTAPPSPAPVSDTIAVAPPDDDDETRVPPSSMPAPKKKAPRKRKPATTNGEEGGGSTAPKRKRPRKQPAPRVPENGEGIVAGGSDDASQAPPKAKAPRRRARSPTPEDAENQTIDRSTMKLSELTRDLGIGKKFKHADVVAERTRQAREANKLRRLEKKKRAMGLLPQGDEESSSRAGTPAEGTNDRNDPGANDAATGPSMADPTLGFELVDGQIVLNQQSLMIDRHAAHRDHSALEAVEEDDFTKLTTSSSYRRESRNTGPNHWNEVETDRFYHYLKMFGTDFDTIANCFPGRTRRSIKLKFNREENLRPNRINATIMVRSEKKVAIDLEAYKAAQRDWQDSDKIKEEQSKLAEEHNEDIRRLKEQRRADGLLDDDDDDTPNGGALATNDDEADGELEEEAEAEDQMGPTEAGAVQASA
ncbi:hypothetical protein F4778DRAFT_738770 [Xylariomycetidae sp. FL2044]|nr:hypothetical protein F4778DRAFT_738770 [Xylariomycetidae sp. FL2044]